MPLNLIYRHLLILNKFIFRHDVCLMFHTKPLVSHNEATKSDPDP